MPDALMTVAEFCQRNRISHTCYYNLAAICRGPDVVRVGVRVLITTKAETAWRERMACEPVLGDIRRMADAARASRKATAA